MYIDGMRTAGRLLAILIAVALVSPWVPSLLCARPGAIAMPCCTTQGPCGSQMQTNRCCSVERGPVVPAGDAGIQTNSPGSGTTRHPLPATVDGAASDGAEVLAHLGGHRLWYPSAHGRSPSLFLRHAAILR